MNNIKNILNCGNTFKYPYENIIHFTISKFEDIYFKIIPLFKKYNIEGIKALDFEDFCLIANLIFDNIHLTAEGIKKINLIKSGMNRGRQFINLKD